MAFDIDRRAFLGTSALIGAGLLTGSRASGAEFKTTLKKALIGKPTEDTLKSWKAAGFDGIESTDRAASLEDAKAARVMAEKIGMDIQSMLWGWANFNEEPAKVKACLAEIEHSLNVCQAYDAKALLLVPCRVGGMDMPLPWEFDIEFDEETLMVSKVASGDNSKYQAYIDAQNHATKASIEAVKSLIGVAEQTGVVIALENVWNNLWVKPKFFKAFIASFDSPWVQAYYDIGNHVRYADPVEWIETLGKLICRIHVKDFKLDRSKGAGGDFVDIRSGSVDWPAVRKALDDVGYNGWMTIEGSGGLSLEQQSEYLDLIIAGK